MTTNERPGWPIPELWPGETGVILAGGPSLDLAQVRHVALARLENKCRVLAVNDAVFLAWWADWLHACDYKWWNWHRNRAVKFDGVRTTCTETVPEQWAHYLRAAPPDKETGRRGGIPDEPDMVAGGGGGGYQAIQCFVKAGLKRILLLGFDMKPEVVPGEFDKKGKPILKAHWFGDHEDRIRSDYKNDMLPNFPTLIEPLRERGVEVINCSPDSALTCFPMGKIMEVL